MYIFSNHPTQIEKQDQTAAAEPCPVCGKTGRPVGSITVKHLVRAEDKDAVTAKSYYVCMNEACAVVYYETSADGGMFFSVDQMEVPIWFKSGADPKYACYCSRVTEDEVIRAVVEQGARTVAEVNRLTGAMKNADCKRKNPLGVCCHPVIQEAIDKALSTKK